MANEEFVAYFRVPAARREAEGGSALERQRAKVQEFLDGGGRALAGEFTEAETGPRKTGRPQLRAALDACRRRRAGLLVAELGRLRRSATFLLTLEGSGVAFVCADAPDVNPATVEEMALAAEEWCAGVRVRVRNGLAEAKARGVRLGAPQNLSNRALGTARGNAAKARRADERAAMLRALVAELRAGGANSLRELAEALDARGIAAPRGGRWSPPQLCRALARAGGEPDALPRGLGSAEARKRRRRI